METIGGKQILKGQNSYDASRGGEITCIWKDHVDVDFLNDYKLPTGAI